MLQNVSTLIIFPPSGGHGGQEAEVDQPRPQQPRDGPDRAETADLRPPGRRPAAAARHRDPLTRDT